MPERYPEAVAIHVVYRGAPEWWLLNGHDRAADGDRPGSGRPGIVASDGEPDHAISVPEAPEVIVIQPTPDLAVHGHVADTLTDAGPPALPAVMAVAETAGVHGAGDGGGGGGGGALPPAELLWTN